MKYTATIKHVSGTLDGQLVSARPVTAPVTLEELVMRSYDELSAGQIDQAITDIPGVVLRFAADKLDDGELKRCLSVDPICACQNRERLAPRRQAMVLASSFQYCFLDGYGGDLPALHEEIIRSITGYSEEWLAAHGNCFDRILELLRFWVNLETTPALLTRILHETPDALRGPFSRFLAASL